MLKKVTDYKKLVAIPVDIRKEKVYSISKLITY